MLSQNCDAGLKKTTQLFSKQQRAKPLIVSRGGAQLAPQRKRDSAVL